MPNPQVRLQTSLGDIDIELCPGQTPATVENFLMYVDEGYYAGTIFHRVIPGFMVQGGGLDAALNRVPGHDPIVNEAKDGLDNDTGTIAMARTSDPNSATSQFFINVKDNDFLNYRGPGNPGYCAFGKVVDGMDVVRQIEKTPTTTKQGYQDVPRETVTISGAVRL